MKGHLQPMPPRYFALQWVGEPGRRLMGTMALVSNDGKGTWHVVQRYADVDGGIMIPARSLAAWFRWAARCVADKYDIVPAHRYGYVIPSWDAGPEAIMNPHQA